MSKHRSDVQSAGRNIVIFFAASQTSVLSREVNVSIDQLRRARRSCAGSQRTICIACGAVQSPQHSPCVSYIRYHRLPGDLPGLENTGRV